jgi:hypothetical protein
MHTPERNKSLRKKGNKKPGGQKGHEGNSLSFSDQVDEVIKYSPAHCGKCGKLFHRLKKHYMRADWKWIFQS